MPSDVLAQLVEAAGAQSIALTSRGAIYGWGEDIGTLGLVLSSIVQSAICMCLPRTSAELTTFITPGVKRWTAAEIRRKCYAVLGCAHTSSDHGKQL